MGTLSKTFAGCGGYVAGSAALVELLKFSAPGFIYSVGMPPPIASAIHAAIGVMLEEPQRVERLRDNGRTFLRLAREHGLDTGLAEGLNIIPVVTGKSVLAARLSNALFDLGINVQPIVFPAVEEKAARLRFFLSSSHTEDQIRKTVELTAQELKRLSAMP
jgi:8-amino-7-oxononanoate synthase